MSEKKAIAAKTAEIGPIDYKDTELLKKFVTKFNKIVPRQYSGTPLKVQKKISQAIKRARYMALIPYVLYLKKKVVE